MSSYLNCVGKGLAWGTALGVIGGLVDYKTGLLGKHVVSVIKFASPAAAALVGKYGVYGTAFAITTFVSICFSVVFVLVKLLTSDEVEKLRKQIADKVETRSRLEAEMKALGSNIDSLAQKIETDSKEKTEKEATLASAEETTKGSIKTEIQSLNERISNLSEEKAKVATEFAEKGRILSALILAIQQLEEKLPKQR